MNKREDSRLYVIVFIQRERERTNEMKSTLASSRVQFVDESDNKNALRNNCSVGYVGRTRSLPTASLSSSSSALGQLGYVCNVQPITAHIGVMTRYTYCTMIREHKTAHNKYIIRKRRRMVNRPPHTDTQTLKQET